jgi:hypothetical protein
MLAPLISPADLAQRLVDAFGTRRIIVHNEVDLQDAVELRLKELQQEYSREKALSRTDRPDFGVGNIAIEVKTSAPFAATIRQLHRYAKDDQISGLILVTLRAPNFPADVAGKPLAVIELWRNLL